jgi:hypothetical protein
MECSAFPLIWCQALSALRPARRFGPGDGSLIRSQVATALTCKLQTRPACEIRHRRHSKRRLGVDARRWLRGRSDANCAQKLTMSTIYSGERRGEALYLQLRRQQKTPPGKPSPLPLSPRNVRRAIHAGCCAAAHLDITATRFWPDPAYFGVAAAVSPGGMIRSMKLDTFSPGLNGSGTSLSTGFTL